MVLSKLSILTFALPLLTSAHVEHGCVDSVEPGMDYFPHKVEAKYSEHWDIEYFDTYKILKNKFLNLSYLLYLCGTEIPSDVSTDDYAATIRIPVENVGLTQTPSITFMEQINARDKIAAFLTDPQYIWSPCFAQDVESGNIALLEDRGEDGPALVGQNPPDVADMMAFASQWDNPPFTDVVKVSESAEKTNAAIFEWVKYYSVFFNEEETANAVVEAADSRLECIKEKTSAVATDSPKKPTLLWAYYSDYCGGWDVGECDNYYCEFADICSIDILSSSEGTNQEAADKCGAVYMTTEEFIEFGKDADFWFFPSSNWNTTLNEFSEELSQFKSVQNKDVFDNQGLGSNAWFERRLAQYYDVAEDMCVSVGMRPEVLLERRTFWRDVFTEKVPEDGADAECTPAFAANILSSTEGDCTETTSSSRAVSASLITILLAVVGAGIANLC